jgi:DeoR family fructose operon transcriptional repressor
VKITGNSLKVDRLKSVLEIVASKKRVSLSDLEQMLDVSRITIQRDLVELENRRLLKRFHGGAMSLDYSDGLYDMRVRRTINVDIKRNIVKKAVSLIKPQSYIGMDASSTTYYLSEQVFPSNCFILACGIDTFSNLTSNSNIDVVLSGGRLNKKTNSLVGPEAIAMIRKYHFDLIFISSEAYVPGAGFFDPMEEEVAVKRALIESSAKTIMLIDSSKVKRTGGVRICDNKEIDLLITDNPSDESFKADFKENVL